MLAKNGTVAIDLDQIEKHVELKMESFQKMRDETRRLVLDSTESIMKQIRTLDIGYLISHTMDQSTKIHSELLKNNLPKEIKELSPEQLAAIESWSRSLINKVNHVHIQALKNYVLQTPNRHT
jgi:glutamyl-tRNA reductase